MPMIPEPTRFERALQRVREQQARVERQQKMIATLEKVGESHLLPAAYRLLTQMQSTQRLLSE
ncbi:MAG TPA: hypothetical protein VIL69_04505, partial [Roseomonas sp.]